MRVVLTWIQVQNEFQIEVGSLINPTQNTHMKYEATGHSESKKKTKMKRSVQGSATQTTMMMNRMWIHVTMTCQSHARRCRLYFSYGITITLFDRVLSHSHDVDCFPKMLSNYYDNNKCYRDKRIEIRMQLYVQFTPLLS